MLVPLSQDKSEEAERTIRAFEEGKLTYEQAGKMLQEICEDHPALYFLEIELYFAWDLKYGTFMDVKI